MALRSILLRITGDPSDAKRALAETTAELRKFDGQEAQARISIKDEAIKAQIEIVKARLERLGKQEATPKVQIAMGRAVEQLERLELRLSRLDGKDVDIDINVRGATALDVLSRVGTALAGAGASVGIGGLASVIQGLGATLVIVVPLLVALASAMAAAAAGAGVLAIALAGALGPAALLGVFALSRLTNVLAAFKERQDAAGAGASKNAAQIGAANDRIASAQDAVRSATDSLAGAQTNLSEQAIAANRAWQDSIEAVKDDLLGVQHAQLGIDDANLSLREAQQALKDFTAQSGLAGDAFGAIFDKFTDVAVDTSGLQAAIKSAAGASGSSVGGDDELKLERLILNVREAKLGEKDATDRLHDSNVALSRDRATEADFARRGIAAYGPYAAAVASVAQAQRSLRAANRSLTQAQVASVASIEGQTSAYDKLSKSEKGLVDALERISDAVNKAFGPAFAAIVDGAVSALDRLARVLNNAGIVAVFREIGRAIGDVFRTLGRTAVSPEILQSFAQLALGGAQLIRVFGSRIFNDLFLILTRIATAALPMLLDGASRLADQFDRWEVGTRNSEAVRAKITELVNKFFDAVKALREVVQATVTVARVVNAVSSVFVTAFSRLFAVMRFFIDLAKSRTFQIIAAAVATFLLVFSGVGEVAAGVLAFVRGLSLMVRVVGGLAALGAIPGKFFSAIGSGARSAARAVSGFVRDVRETVGSVAGVFSAAFTKATSALGRFASTMEGVGGKIGRGLVNGIKGGLRGLESIGRFVANGLIDALNFAIHAINHGLPDKLNLPGLPDINLPDNPIPEIPHLAAGGIVRRSIFAQIGEGASPEAVLPLTRSVFGQLAGGIVGQMPALTGGMLAPAMAGGGGTRIDNFHTHIDAPAGELPDTQHVATALTRLMERRAGGDVGQE